VLDGIGRVLVDVRRDPGFDNARGYTFPVLATTERLVQRDSALARAVLDAVTDAQHILVENPSSATAAAAKVFPPREASLIARLIERDSPYYDPTISHRDFQAVNAFARDLGLLGASAATYDQVVVAQFTSETS
jgi:NitT/TauT family transport system substrate-binding protein